MSAFESVKRFARDELLGDLSFEFDAVGAVFGHGLHPRKPGGPSQFPSCNLSTVRGALHPPENSVRAGIGSMRENRRILYRDVCSASRAPYSCLGPVQVGA